MQAPTYEKLAHRLREREELLHGSCLQLPDIDDLTFLVREVWRARSCRTALCDMLPDKGLTRVTDNLTLTRSAPVLQHTIEFWFDVENQIVEAGAIVWCHMRTLPA